MTLRTGKPLNAVEAGFTLIELILVMTMLAVVLSVTAPSLSRFFRGRSLDAEATRFLALTRYGQNRAVAEGLPVILWIDAAQGAYGLQADASYLEQDNKAREFKIHPDVQVEVENSLGLPSQAVVWKGSGGIAGNLPRIHFNPDGFVSASSPRFIVFRQSDDGEIWIGPSRNQLNYEIQTNQVQSLRR